MSKMGNYFQKYVDLFTELADRTTEDGLERGVSFCKKDNEIALKQNKGEEGSISIDECGQGEKIIGWFHTHPGRAEAFPSPPDIIHSAELDLEFFCIGAGEDIKCFETKVKDKDIKEFEKALSKYIDRSNKLYEETDVIYPTGEYELYKVGA